MKTGKILSYTGVALLGFCISQGYSYLDNKSKPLATSQNYRKPKEIYKAEGMQGLDKTESLIKVSSKDMLDEEGRAFIIWEEMADRITNLKQYQQGPNEGMQATDSISGKKTIIKTPKEMPNAIIPLKDEVKKRDRTHSQCTTRRSPDPLRKLHALRTTLQMRCAYRA